MWSISRDFDKFLRKRDREWLVKVDIDGVEYDHTQIVDFKIDNSLCLRDEFEVGTANLSECELRVRTLDELPANARVVPYVALSKEGMTWLDADYPWDETEFPWTIGNTEWMPLGEFYIDSREKLRDVWVYTCYDKLVWADSPYLSELSYPATMLQVWNEICVKLNYTYDSSVVIAPEYIIPAGPMGFTMRQIMGYIASANGASVYVAKDGKIKFKKFSKNDTPVFEMTETDYIRASQTNPIKTYTRVVITYDTEEGLYYEAGEGTEHQTLHIENPYASQEMADKLLDKFLGFSYMPINMDARGYPHLEVGDVISFERSESITLLEAQMEWDEADFPWDGIKTFQTIILHEAFHFKGGLRMSIEAPSISEQQSEFPQTGAITDAINKLGRSSVRLERKYYGASFSRDEGFIVEREDGLSKVKLNSDEFRFTVEDEDALWFDVQAKKFKFSGTLEGVDGVFTGTIEAGSFIGGNINIGEGNFTVDSSGNMIANRGTFRGTLDGVSGTFTGVIQAGYILGGNINIGNGAFTVNSSGHVYAGAINITGGNITGAARIFVSEDVYIGDRLYMNPSSFTSDIIFAPGITAFADPAGGGLYFFAPGGIYANGVRIDS